MAAGIAIAAVGVGSSLIGGAKAAKRAKKIGRRNAELIRETAEENLRRMQIARGQKVGAAKAGVYASNVQYSGTSKKYVEALDQQFISDMAWEQRKSRLEERLARAGGQAAASTIQSSALTSAIGYVGQAAQSGLFSSSPPPPTQGQVGTSLYGGSVLSPAQQTATYGKK